MLRQRINAKGTSKALGLSKYLLWICAVVAVIVLVVPLSVMFGKKKAHPPPSNVLVPLYIYPDLGAWDPLYTV